MSDRARLFSAVVPPPRVSQALHRALAAGDAPAAGARDLRWATPAQWHVTLGFYGSDLVAERVRWLRERLSGIPAPELRLQGSGSFRGVLWVGVHGGGLADLVAATRPDAEERPFVGHLSLAFARGGTRTVKATAQAAISRWQRSLAGFDSPSWRAREVVLLRSDPAGEPGLGPRYSPVERFRLGAPD